MPNLLYKSEILSLLQAKNIPFETLEHPAAYTMADLDALGITQKGTILKNLFLRDGSGKHHFLVSAPECADIDLKKLKEQLGSSRLSFASTERLWEHLRIAQGSVSPLCLLNEESGTIPMVFDEALRGNAAIGVHPNDNTAMLWLRFEDLCALIREHGNPVLLLPFPHH